MERTIILIDGTTKSFKSLTDLEFFIKNGTIDVKTAKVLDFPKDGSRMKLSTALKKDGLFGGFKLVSAFSDMLERAPTKDGYCIIEIDQLTRIATVYNKHTQAVSNKAICLDTNGWYIKFDSKKSYLKEYGLGTKEMHYTKYTDQLQSALSEFGINTLQFNDYKVLTTNLCLPTDIPIANAVDIYNAIIKNLDFKFNLVYNRTDYARSIKHVRKDSIIGYLHNTDNTSNMDSSKLMFKDSRVPKGFILPISGIYTRLYDIDNELYCKYFIDTGSLFYDK